MSKAPTAPNPIGNKPNADGRYMMNVRQPVLLLEFLRKETCVPMVALKKTDKGQEIFIPYLLDKATNKECLLSKIYPKALVQTTDFNGGDCFEFHAEGYQEFQEAWIEIYRIFIRELERIKAPQLTNQPKKFFLHEDGTERVKLGSRTKLPEILKKYEEAPGSEYSAAVGLVYCMKPEDSMEWILGVSLYLGYPSYSTGAAYLRANPRKRQRVEKSEESGKEASATLDEKPSAMETDFKVGEKETK